jgi:hypothetical protein
MDRSLLRSLSQNKLVDATVQVLVRLSVSGCHGVPHARYDQDEEVEDRRQ